MALTKEQIAKRKFSLGGSEVSGVFGVSPYKTAADVWTEKLKGRKPSDKRLEDLAEWGELIEPCIREWYSRRLPKGAYVSLPGQLRSKTIPWATSTPDGVVCYPVAVGDEPRLDRGLEIKNRGSNDKPRWADGVPCDVAAQAYWGMYVSGLDKWDCIALVNGNTPFLHTLVWDDELIAAMASVTQHFWNAVEAKEPPEMEWVRPELDLIQGRLISEADQAAFRRAAYWAKRESK
jgi:putative phage-type endonuclease